MTSEAMHHAEMKATYVLSSLQSNPPPSSQMTILSSHEDETSRILCSLLSSLNHCQTKLDGNNVRPSTIMRRVHIRSSNIRDGTNLKIRTIPRVCLLRQFVSAIALVDWRTFLKEKLSFRRFVTSREWDTSALWYMSSVQTESALKFCTRQRRVFGASPKKLWLAGCGLYWRELRTPPLVEGKLADTRLRLSEFFRALR